MTTVKTLSHVQSKLNSYDLHNLADILQNMGMKQRPENLVITSPITMITPTKTTSLTIRVTHTFSDHFFTKVFTTLEIIIFYQ